MIRWRRTLLIASTGLVAANIRAQTSVGVATPQGVQQLRHMHHATFTPDEGNFSLGAASLMQSSDGYLWIGAIGKLLRFDGVRFAQVDSGTAPALRSSAAMLLEAKTLDPWGAMWIGKGDGSLIRYAHGEFTTVMAADSTRDLRARIVSDRSGRLWAMSRGRIIVIENGKVIPAPVPSEVPLADVLGVVADTADGVWFGMRDGSLWHIARHSAEHAAPPASQSGVSTRPLLQSRDGTLWVFGKNLQSIKDGVWRDITLPNGAIISPQVAIETHDHTVLLGTQGQGLVRIVAGVLEQYSVVDGLSDMHVSAVIEDSEHNLWLRTDAGVDQLYVAPMTTVGRGDRVPFESPLSITPDANAGMWIRGYEDGRLFHARGGIFDDQWGEVRWTAAVFPSAERHAIAATSGRGGIWAIGRTTDGLMRVSNQDLAMPYLARDVSLSGLMIEDLHGDLWGTRERGGVADAFGRALRGKFSASSFTSRLKPFRVGALNVDAHNHVWIIERKENTLIEMVGDSVVWKHVLDVRGSPEIRLARSGGDTLWIVPADGDITRVIGHELHSIPLERGRSQQVVSGQLNIAISGDDFWFANQAEISRFSVAEINAFADRHAPPPARRRFGEADGLRVPRTTFQNEMAAFAKNGRVWFSTPGGVAVYNPRFDQPNSTAPRVKIEEIVVDGKIIDQTKHIRIDAQPGRTDIHFTAISLRMPARVRIEYRLVGADSKWMLASSARVATYTQLRPGDYTFEARAWNENGVPSENLANITFEILPTWYQSLWTRSIFLLALLCLGPLIVYQRQRARSREQLSLLHLRFDAALAERNRVAGELHDTLLQEFTGITLQLGGVQRSLMSTHVHASARLATVLERADATLRDARQAIWDMRSPELAGLSLPGALERAVRLHTADSSIALSFDVNGEARRVSPTVESGLYRIGREAVANAVRHANATAIRVSLNYTPNNLQLTVSDNGQGMPPNAELAATSSGHFGVHGMRERVGRLQGTFELASIEGHGTTLTIVIPTPFH